MRIKLIILTMLMISSISFAQDFDKMKVFSVISAPGAYDDGFNFGAQFEYTNRTLYVGPEFYAFPNLHDLPYYHLIGRFGLNQYFGKFTHWGRIYSGGRAGAIRRDGTTQALLGLEAGFDIIISDTVLLGVSGTSDMKTDSKVYSNDDYHTVNAVFVKLGVSF